MLEETKGGVVTWSAEWAVETPNEIEALKGQHMTIASILELWYPFRFIKAFVGKVQ